MLAELMESEVDVADRAAWHDWRRRGIGASEMAAVLGVSPFATPLDVYAAKVGRDGPRPESAAMRIGTALEPALETLYAAETGRAIAARQVARSDPRAPYIRATLDAVAADGRVIELKTAGSLRAGEVGEAGTDELPAHWLVQVQAQLLVVGDDEADVAVLTGGRALDFRVFTVRRDEDLQRLIRDAAGAFWGRVRREDPPPIGRPGDLRHLALFGADPDPIAFHEDEAGDWWEYVALGEEMARLNGRREGLKAAIHAAMGRHATAILPDGSRIVRRTVTRKAYAVAESSYTTLQHQHARGGT